MVPHSVQPQHIEIIKLIGRGNYSKVFLCRHLLTNQQFVLKAIQRDLLNDIYQRAYQTELKSLRMIQEYNRLLLSYKATDIELSEATIEDTQEQQKHQRQSPKRELCRSLTFDQVESLLFEVKHDKMIHYKDSSLSCDSMELSSSDSRVIHYISHIDTFTFRYEKQVIFSHAILLEYATHQSLERYIDSPAYQYIPFDILRLIIREVLLGLKEMHNAGLAHRDIKEQNVVFCEGFKVKLIDLSFSGRDSAEVCGTREYLPPELLQREYTKLHQSSQNLIDTSLPINDHYWKIDTFAVGVLIFRMLTKKYPFKLASRFDSKYKYFFANQLKDFWSGVSFLTENSPCASDQSVKIQLFPAATPEQTNQLDGNKRDESQSESRTAQNEQKQNFSEQTSQLKLTQQSLTRSFIDEEILPQTESLSFNDTASIKDLIYKLLVPDVEERLGVEDALNHSFFAHQSIKSASIDDLSKFISRIASTFIQSGESQIE